MDADSLKCVSCDLEFRIENQKIFFTDSPTNIIPSEYRERGTDKETPWRQANGRFLRKQFKKLPKDTLVLDVGAGRGDFLPFYKDFSHILLDIYPYPETNIVCDLTIMNPFRGASFDTILLMNVLEHVFSPMQLLGSLKEILKPNGKIFIAIPFLLKIHQSPLDFQRFTHFAIQKLAEETGFKISYIDGFYDPVGLILESTRYYRFWVRPELKRFSRLTTGFLLLTLDWLLKILSLISPKAYNNQPFKTNNPAPIGYHVILQKRH